ncbi:MAG: alcohol dehydrogenase catalytic domain-containing protein [Deltaproteobacteria bacterium]|nr:alcohol dehydrogenase catalytic domain-containing protein [Deltaproteobacteria bacterium]
MKAMVLNEYNSSLELIEMDTPRVKRDEILLKVRACGICQTDLKIIRGEIPPAIVTLPHIIGHEVVGEVVGVGEFVSGVDQGDVGVVYIYITCRECQWCLTGRENLCINLKRVGFELSGGFEEYLQIPAYAFCPFKKDMPLHEMAILADAIGTPYHAITRLADVKVGQSVLIVGAGGLGIHGVQIAKLCGAKVFVVDKDQNALNFAQEFGADEIFSPDKALQGIRDLTGGQGVDAVIEIVGTPETLSWSLPSLKKGGKLIVVGYAPGRPFPLDTMAMHYNEWEIIGSRLSTKTELLQVIKLVEEGKIKPVVTKTFPFAQANEAIKALNKKTTLGRIVLTF